MRWMMWMEINAFSTMHAWGVLGSVYLASSGRAIDSLMDLLERAARIQSVLRQRKSAVRDPPVEWQIHSSRHYDFPYSICASWRLSRDEIFRSIRMTIRHIRTESEGYVNSMHLNDNVKNNSFVTCNECKEVLLMIIMCSHVMGYVWILYYSQVLLTKKCILLY